MLGFAPRSTPLRIIAWARAAAFLRRQTRAGSVSVAALVAAYGVAALLSSSNAPPHFWPSPHWGADLLTGLGVAAGVASVVLAVGTNRFVATADANLGLAETCRNVEWLVETTERTIPRRSLGVHVWQIAGPPGFQRLKRRGTYRAAGSHPLPITWVKGKGVVGACWASDEGDQLVDLSELRTLAPDAAAFRDLSAEDRLNLSWPEYNMSRHYSTIWVCKLYGEPEDAPKLIGFLSIDISEEGHTDALARALKRSTDEIGNLRKVCQTVLDQGRRWLV
jgi:hypothetical protein